MHMKKEMKIQNRLGIDLSNQVFNGLGSVQKMVQAELDEKVMQQNANDKVKQCNKDGCANTKTLRRACVMDRPPPTLVIHGAMQTYCGDEIPEGLCDTLDLWFYVAGEKSVLKKLLIRYRFWGCVVMTNSNHFKLLAYKASNRNGDGKFILYDGMSNKGKFQEIKTSVLDFLKSDKHGISLPIYIRVGEVED